MLFDQASASPHHQSINFPVHVISGDICDRSTIDQLIRSEASHTSVFHLASVVSAQGEQDFDLAMRVNLDGGRNVFEALRKQGGDKKLIFASSIVAFGGDEFTGHVSDATKQLPETTYGVTKSICETLVNDYTRKGYFDGRSARLPTVIIRPGKPNAAASSFASGIFREPLQGIDMTCPVHPELSMPVAGYRSVVENILRLHDLDGSSLGGNRALGLPSRTVTIGDMKTAVERLADRRELGQITMKLDPDINEIVSGWAKDADCERALGLGLIAAEPLDTVISHFIDDYLT